MPNHQQHMDQQNSHTQTTPILRKSHLDIIGCKAGGHNTPTLFMVDAVVVQGYENQAHRRQNNPTILCR
jgi:hypothetical protein